MLDKHILHFAETNLKHSPISSGYFDFSFAVFFSPHNNSSLLSNVHIARTNSRVSVSETRLICNVAAINPQTRHSTLSVSRPHLPTEIHTLDMAFNTISVLMSSLEQDVHTSPTLATTPCCFLMVARVQTHQLSFSIVMLFSHFHPTKCPAQCTASL